MDVLMLVLRRHPVTGLGEPKTTVSKAYLEIQGGLVRRLMGIA